MGVTGIVGVHVFVWARARVAMWRIAQVRASVHDLAQDRTQKGLPCTWIDENEWKTVCSLLYSSSGAERRRGVARVAGWKARGTVPFPVEITADIVDSQLWEEEGVAMMLTEQAFALQYSMVVTRWAGQPCSRATPLTSFNNYYSGSSMVWLTMGCVVVEILGPYSALSHM